MKPSYASWNHPVFDYSTLQEFLGVTSLADGIHTISINGHFVDFLFQKRSSDALLVVFNAAVPATAEKKPPYFSGINIAAGAGASLLAINDPSLYLDDEIRLAWYAGSGNLPLQNLLPTIVDKVTSLTAERIVMMGGSGGGFASLYYATVTKFPVIAFVHNPQTSVVKYVPRIARHFARVCFDWKGGQLEPALSAITFDLVKHYKDRRAPVVYLQNTKDYGHVTDHATPFIRNYGLEWTGISQLAKDFYLHVGDWGEGHVVPPYNLLLAIAKLLCNSQRNMNVEEVAAMLSATR